jgi:hypothetical protein
LALFRFRSASASAQLSSAQLRHKVPPRFQNPNVQYALDGIMIEWFILVKNVFVMFGQLHSEQSPSLEIL